jgi:ribosomal protein S18 acetylase RimI-like enzyme
VEIEFTCPPSPADVKCIYNGLAKFNSRYFEGLNEQQFGAFLKDSEAGIIGGITGKLLYTTCHINYLWISEEYRSNGLGKKMMRSVEAEVVKRKIENIFVETYSFQAPEFYRLFGFIEVGRYRDYPRSGTDKIVYRKKLS